MRIRVALLVAAASLLAFSGCHHRKGGYLAPAPVPVHAAR